MSTEKTGKLGKRFEKNAEPKEGGFVNHLKENWWKYLLGGIGATATAVLGYMLGSEPDRVEIGENEAPSQATFDEA